MMKLSRILAIVVGGMLFVQPILGGSAVLLNFPIACHLYWGIATFIVLVVATGIAVRDYGRSSPTFKIGVATTTKNCSK